MENSLNDFRALVDPWIASYDAAVVAGMGVFEGTERRLLSGRIVFAPTLPETIKIQALNGQKLWAAAEHVSRDSDQIERMFADIAGGIISIGGKPARLLADTTNRYDFSYAPSYPPGFNTANQSAARLPVLFVSGESRFQALNRGINTAELEWYLRSLNPPFFDLSDLHSYYGLPSPGDRSLVELVVRPPVEIDARSTIADGKMYIRLLACRGVEVEQIAVGYKLVGGVNGGLRTSLSSEKFSWGPGAKFREGVASVEIADTPTAQCYLTYAGSSIQTWWVIDPKRHLNPRRAVHAAFDPDLGVVNRLLFDTKRSDSRTFEDGVAMLLGMLGFSVTQHGRSQKLSDAPDLVATTPGGQIAVVECTTGLPDQDDQVAKALRRAELLRRSLTSAGWPGIRVLAVVVTSLTTTEVEGQRRHAENQGVLVLCLEDLQAALTRTIAPVDADQVLREQEEQLAKAQLFTRN